ncbi:MAG: phage integrase N-terminal SAM-like domain-containing protein [Flammeovirgaceae bacterium]|nr:phage integrase N-terminal SAM-like domain-containing protein [Flammeovirgaceae bacterium]
MVKQVVLEPLFHRGSNCIGFHFPHEREVSKAVKQLPNLLYTRTHGCFYVIDTREARDFIIAHFRKANITVDYSKFQKIDAKSNLLSTREESGTGHPELRIIQAPNKETPHIRAYKKLEHFLKLKRYSSSTLATYLSQFKLFLRFYPDSDPVDLNEQDVHNYLLYLVETKKVGPVTQNQAINAIKCYYEKVLKRD